MPEDDPVNQAADPSAVARSESLPPAAGVPEPQDRSAQSDPDDGPRLGTDPVDARSSDIRQRTAPRLVRRLTILLGLLLIGLATGIWAIALFPSRPQVVTPASFSMLLANETNVNSIFVTITPEGQSADDIEVSASTDAASPPLSQTGETIAFVFLEKVVIRKCPADAICRKEADKSVSVIVMPVIFDESGVTKNYNFVVSNLHLGFSGNGESAVADLPTVLGGGSAAASEILYIKYQVPDAAAYDWSTPPLLVAAGGVAWSEPLTVSSSSVLTAEAPPSEITGTNHAAEAQDNRDTFISGILLGIAGAAAIAAAQEGLHLLFDDRNDGAPRKLRRMRAQPE